MSPVLISFISVLEQFIKSLVSSFLLCLFCLYNYDLMLHFCGQFYLLPK